MAMCVANVKNMSSVFTISSVWLFSNNIFFSLFVSFFLAFVCGCRSSSSEYDLGLPEWPTAIFLTEHYSAGECGGEWNVCVSFVCLLRSVWLRANNNINNNESHIHFGSRNNRQYDERQSECLWSVLYFGRAYAFHYRIRSGKCNDFFTKRRHWTRERAATKQQNKKIQMNISFAVATSIQPVAGQTFFLLLLHFRLFVLSQHASPFSYTDDGPQYIYHRYLSHRCRNQQPSQKILRLCITHFSHCHAPSSVRPPTKWLVNRFWVLEYIDCPRWSDTAFVQSLCGSNENSPLGYPCLCNQNQSNDRFEFLFWSAWNWISTWWFALLLHLLALNIYTISQTKRTRIEHFEKNIYFGCWSMDTCFQQTETQVNVKPSSTRLRLVFAGGM